jgi:hypothetical protein
MPAMAPSTTSSAKITATFDVASLFVADKEARTGAAQALASQSKNEGAAFFGDIGLPEAIVKVRTLANVRIDWWMMLTLRSARRPFPTKRTPQHVKPLAN